MKLLEVFSVLKKQETLTKKTQSDIQAVLQTIVKDNVTNPVDAYVVLDCAKKILEEAQESIKDKVIDYIDSTGENQGYGVTLSIQTRQKIHYKDDPKWQEVNESFELVKARLSRREQEIKTQVIKDEDEGNPSIVTVEKNKILVAHYEKS
jgi:hypothetical protein